MKTRWKEAATSTPGNNDHENQAVVCQFAETVFRKPTVCVQRLLPSNYFLLFFGIVVCCVCSRYAAFYCVVASSSSLHSSFLVVVCCWHIQTAKREIFYRSRLRIKRSFFHRQFSVVQRTKKENIEGKRSWRIKLTYTQCLTVGRDVFMCFEARREDEEIGGRNSKMWWPL